MGVWFSASAVVPALATAWGLDDSGRAWLTMSVQAGFVAGALLSALLNLADRIPARHALHLVGAGRCARHGPHPRIAAHGLTAALPLRFLTGAFIAGVYPVGMKIMATWTKQDRGLAIGLLVGTLAVGSASPHLINAFGSISDWQPVLLVAAAASVLGALIAFLFVREGPYRSASVRFNWTYMGQILRQR